MQRRRLATTLALTIISSALVLAAMPGVTLARTPARTPDRHGDVQVIRIVLSTQVVPAAAPAPIPGVSPLLDAGPESVRAMALAQGQPRGGGECADRAHSATGGTWQTTYTWFFRASSTPEGITRAGAKKALQDAVGNITGARNDCGRGDSVSASAAYAGTTTRKPALTAAGACGDRDGFNVIGFGRLPSGIAGLTCIWVSGDRILEADVRLDGGSRWATSLATCDGESMLEAVATHEFGHVFGMGHVSESAHGRLTMSTRLDGLCENQESKLGLGDLLGLEKLY